MVQKVIFCLILHDIIYKHPNTFILPCLFPLVSSLRFLSNILNFILNNFCKHFMLWLLNIQLGPINRDTSTHYKKNKVIILWLKMVLISRFHIHNSYNDQFFYFPLNSHNFNLDKCYKCINLMLLKGNQ
jgi:hypothetical protein